jgi:hypothetical protein
MIGRGIPWWRVGILPQYACWTRGKTGVFSNEVLGWQQVSPGRKMPYRTREAPKEVTKRLCDTRPNMELVWYVDRWRLGVWRFSREAAKTATMKLGMMAAHPESPEKWACIRYLRDCQRGFRPLFDYSTDDFGSIVKDWMYEWYDYRKDREARFERALDNAMVKPKMDDALLDKIRSESWSDFRRHFRTSVVNPRNWD